jgi:pSer/pThr/pTyr-binding forkhead associated (FHA) protein
MKVTLVVVQGRPEGAEIPIPLPLFLIGRDPQCHLRPASDLVSKLHCALVQRHDQVFVRDLKSTNGSFLNNDRIQGEVAVKDGDLLKIGPLVFAVKIQVPAEAVAKESGSDEDQAVTWLLDYAAGTGGSAEDIGGKTTIMESGGPAKSQPQPGEPIQDKNLPDTKVDEATKVSEPEKPKRAVTAELAGELLERMLSPQRKKKR